MPRPLRTRRQAPAPTTAESAVATKKATKPAVAAKKATTTAKTTKATKSTRMRSFEVQEAIPVKARPSRPTTAAPRSSAAPSPAEKQPAARSASSRSAQSTRLAVASLPKSPSPIPEVETRSPTPSTIIPSTPARLFHAEPESSPVQSSNAENHSPQKPLSLASSPPIAQSTPKGNRRTLVIDFSSDAGYTPPRQLGSAERPRLQDLDARTLEPIGTGDEDEDEMLRLPSPTPRKSRGRPSDFLIAEEEEDEDEGAPPPQPPAALRPEGGKGFFVGGDSQEFMIYSDPKSQSPTPTPQSTTNDKDDIMRPPESSPPASPSRKRPSSEAGIDSEAELTAIEPTPRSKRPRAVAAVVKTRGAVKAKAKAKTEETFITTNALRDLLPRRKKSTRNKRAPHEPSSSLDTTSPEEDDDEEDELSRPVRRGRSAAAQKKTPTKQTAAKSRAAKTTKNAWSRPLTSAKKPLTRTYTKKAAEDGDGDGDDEGSSEELELGDGVVKKEGRKKLQEMKQKFEEVDKWEMEFEDLSQGTLEETSDPDKR